MHSRPFFSLSRSPLFSPLRIGYHVFSPPLSRFLTEEHQSACLPPPGQPLLKYTNNSNQCLIEVGKKATEAGKRFQETATVATRQMQESAKNANISSPLPDTNAAEDLKKAAHLLSGFVDKEENEAGFDNIIPPEILRKARGLAIYTVVKAVS